jgi:hypothetical protein
MRPAIHGFLCLGLLPIACAGSPSSPKPVTTASPTASAAAAAPLAPAAGAASPSASASGASTDSLPVSITVSKAHTDGNHYALDAKAPGSITVGGTGEVEITLVAKDRHRINEKHPFKLVTTAEPAAVVHFERAEMDRSSGTFTKTEARFKARYSGTKSGSAKVGGTLSLSVCGAKECIVDNVEIVVPVVVK